MINNGINRRITLKEGGSPAASEFIETMTAGQKDMEKIVFKREDLINAEAFKIGYKAPGDRYFNMEIADSCEEANKKITEWQEYGWKTKILPYHIEKAAKVY